LSTSLGSEKTAPASVSPSDFDFNFSSCSDFLAGFDFSADSAAFSSE